MDSCPTSPTFRNPLPLLATVNILLQFGDEHNFDDALQAVVTHPHIISPRLIVDERADFVSVLTRHIREAQSARIPTSVNHARSVETHTTNVGALIRQAFRRWFCLFPCLEHINLGFCQLSARLNLSEVEERRC